MALGTIRAALLRRLRIDKPSARKRCILLEAPVEVRILIYNYIAPQGYLLAVPYTHYMGLLLSCKQIQDEMTSQALRLTTGHVNKLHAIVDSVPRLRLQPLCPDSFNQLMHITIGVPRWTLYTKTVKHDLFTALSQLLPLHLSSITIEIDDFKTQQELDTMLSHLDPFEFIRWRYAYNATPTVFVPNRTSYYDTHTTYRDIVDIATCINCILAPSLCIHGHLPENAWCLRSSTSASYSNPLPHASIPSPSPNTRTIAFRFKRFHPEVRCPCGDLPHLEYPSKSLRHRWMPAAEHKRLQLAGWIATWFDAAGATKHFSRSEPAAFLWRKIPGWN